MNQQELKEKIQNILENDLVGVLASVENNKPHARYMTFFNDNLTLYTASNNDTHKVDEIEQNPHVHILLGYEGGGIGDEYVEITGTSTVSDSKELKEKVWNEHLKGWFDGPDDPKYIVLKITPDSIRLMNRKGESPQSLEL
jgi:general stress protein 26